MINKYCRYCGSWKTLDDFHVRKASPDGRMYKCKECQKVHAKEFYRLAAARVKERAKEWAQKNRARRCEIVRTYENSHRGERLLYQRQWRARNPERFVLAQQRRRAAGVLAVEDWRLLVQLAGNKCVYCGRESALTLDHMEPISRGGVTCLSNSIPSCKPCNSSKHNKLVADWCFERFGVEGLARTITYMISSKAIARYRRKEIL